MPKQRWTYRGCTLQAEPGSHRRWRVTVTGPNMGRVVVDVPSDGAGTQARVEGERLVDAMIRDDADDAEFDEYGIMKADE